MTKPVSKSEKVPSFKWMRERRQLSGKIYYYLEIPGSAPRQELPLGNNLSEALRSREMILFRHFQSQHQQPIHVIALLDMYFEIMVPISTNKVKAENVSTIQSLSQFFGEVNLTSLTGCSVEDAFQKWRGPRHSLRAKRELSFLAKILAWNRRMKEQLFDREGIHTNAL